MRERFIKRRAFTIVRKAAAEVDEELRFHFEQRVQEYIARGMSPDDAHAAAKERFGDINGIHEECAQLLTEEQRAEARRDWLGDLRQDIHFGVRSALRAPMFSALAILT